jgi:hypothetical protein
MPQLRYLGFPVGEGAIDGSRSSNSLGSFVAFAEPLPVGTTVELDGAPHRVTRVDEGATPGFWARDTRTTPVAIEPELTTPSPPPAEMTSDPEDGAPEPVPEGGGPSRGRRRRRGKTVMGR